jgi:hypothetical protein
MTKAASTRAINMAAFTDFPAPAAGQPLDPKAVEKVPAEIRAVNGMHFSNGALYVGVNDYEQKISSGFYKLTDSDGDDQLDKVETLRAMDSKGDHGVHAVVPVPGSDDFYLICGNNTIPDRGRSQLARAGDLGRRSPPPPHARRTRP